MASDAKRMWREVLVTSIALAVLGVYVATFCYTDWLPWDDGMLGLCGRLCLEGKLPHRDFVDPYTGGLSYLHALSFLIWGTNLRSMRKMLLCWGWVFILSMYYISRRVATPLHAGLLTALAVAWTLPRYFAALPSWYNLFLAMFGIVALLWYMDTNRGRWLFVAGVCGGFSVLLKITGLYYVAAGLLFISFHEQVGACAGFSVSRRCWSMIVAKCLAVVALTGLLILLIRAQLQTMTVIHFVLPGALLAGWLPFHEYCFCTGPFVDRWGRLIRRITPFVAGVVLPVGVYGAHYYWQGGLGDLAWGVFVAPQARLQYASFSLPPVWTLAIAIPSVLLILAGFSKNTWAERQLTLLGFLTPPRMLVLLGLVLAVAYFGPAQAQANVFMIVLNNFRAMIVILAACGSVLLVRHALREKHARRALECSFDARPQSLGERRSAGNQTWPEAYLLLVMCALMSLVQYPYFFWIYFCYVAPLVVLAGYLVVNMQPSAPRRIHLNVLIFLLAFAVLVPNTPRDSSDFEEYATLDVPAGGLSVPRIEKRRYEELVRLVHEHSRSGDYVYAAPDCPEVLFLADRLTPTGTMYDFLEDDADRQPGRILGLLQANRVKVVVLNMTPPFSPPPDSILLQELQEYFPCATKVDNFMVRWIE